MRKVPDLQVSGADVLNALAKVENFPDPLSRWRKVLLFLSQTGKHTELLEKCLDMAA